MSNKPKTKVARLDDIERRGRDIPVREALRTHAFGVNAFTPGDDGTLIGEHDESGSGQEELYIVLNGNATFEGDGETVDAPAGRRRVGGAGGRRSTRPQGHSFSSGRSPGGRRRGTEPSSPWALHPASR